MVTQLIEVEEYGSNKFLEENPLQHVDAGLIHVLKKKNLGGCPIMAHPSPACNIFKRNPKLS